MSPQAGRGPTLVLLACILLAPSVLAQTNIVTAKPDLIPGNVLVDDPPDERTATRICAGVVNIQIPSGAAPAGPFDVKVWVDRNESGQWIRYREDVARSNDVAFVGAENAQFCWNFTLTAGRYRANAFVDSAYEIEEGAPESINETNNVRTNSQPFTVFPAPQPDLVVSELRALPLAGRTGDPQYFFTTVRNIGGAPTLAATLELRDDNGLLDRQLVPALQPNAQKVVVTTTRPDERVPGEFVLHAVIDTLDNVTELNESNNERTLAYSVLPHPAPDFQILGATLEGQLVARRGVRVLAGLENVGNQTAANVTVRLYVDDVPVSNATTGTIEANETLSLDFLIVLTAGPHKLTLRADPDARIGELNEANNLLDIYVEVAETPSELLAPNLIVERFSAAPDDPRPDEVVNMTALVHNLGLTTSEESTIAFYNGARRLGAVKVPALDPDRYYSARLSWAVQPVGIYTLRAFVDPDNTNHETDELDNNHSMYFLIRPPPVPPAPPPVELPPEPETNVTAPSEPTTFEPPAEPAAIEVAAFDLTTAPIPGGVRGTVVAQLRNTKLDPIGRMTVDFKVDGAIVKQILVQGITAAGTAPVNSGDIDLPEGTHQLTAEVKLVGTTEPVATASQTYTAQAGDKSLLPGPGVSLVLALALAVALARRR